MGGPGKTSDIFCFCFAKALQTGVTEVGNDHAANIAQHDRNGWGSLIVWNGIGWDGQTDPIVINRSTLTSQLYIDENWDI